MKEPWTAEQAGEMCIVCESCGEAKPIRDVFTGFDQEDICSECRSNGRAGFMCPICGEPLPAMPELEE